MFKLRNIILIPALLLVLVGCATNEHKSPGTTLHYGESQVVDARITRLFEKVRSEDSIRNKEYILISEPDGLASISLKENKVFVNVSELSKLTDEQIIFVFAHEFGHISEQGRQLAETKAGEQFADFYALLLINEMDIPVLSAISVFHAPVFGPGNAHSDSHGSPNERYTRLIEKAKEAGMKL